MSPHRLPQDYAEQRAVMKAKVRGEGQADVLYLATGGEGKKRPETFLQREARERAERLAKVCVCVC